MRLRKGGLIWSGVSGELGWVEMRAAIFGREFGVGRIIDVEVGVPVAEARRHRWCWFAKEL